CTKANPSGEFEPFWHESKLKGVVANSAPPAPKSDLAANWADGSVAPMAAPAPGEFEINFLPDPTLFDGRFANNGWLQELPKPISKLTWGNAAQLSPATAVRLGLASEDQPAQANGKVVELEHAGRTVEAPVWVMPGHADNSVTVHLGHGRIHAGRVGTDYGFNAYRLRTSAAPWIGRGLAVRVTGRRTSLASTQHHHLMENREVVRSGTVQEPPHIARHALPILYNETARQATGNQWGMVIDLTTCTGCS